MTRQAPISAEKVVGTLLDIVRGVTPALVVEHHVGDDWFFWTGRSHYARDIVEVPFGELLRVDPALAELADLPEEWIASRRGVGEEWRRRWMYEDKYDL